MHAEVTVILVEGPERGDVSRPFHHFVHPLYSPHHLVSLFLREDRRTLVLRNLTWETIHSPGKSVSIREGGGVWRVGGRKCVSLSVCTPTMR